MTWEVNRNEICHELGVPFKTKALRFEDEAVVLAYIKRRHRGRRNLTDNELAALRGEEYEREKKQGERTDLTSGNSCQKSQTDEALAVKHEVSPKTIRRDAKYATAVKTITKASGKQAADSLLAGDLQDVSHKDVVKLAELPAEKQKSAVKGGLRHGEWSFGPP